MTPLPLELGKKVQKKKEAKPTNWETELDLARHGDNAEILKDPMVHLRKETSMASQFNQVIALSSARGQCITKEAGVINEG